MQGLQCKSWRISSAEPNAETVGASEERNEVLWLIPHDNPILVVGPDKTQKPGSNCITYQLEQLDYPSRVLDVGLDHPTFLLRSIDRSAFCVIGVDTQRSRDMLCELIGEVLASLRDEPKPAPLTAPTLSKKVATGNNLLTALDSETKPGPAAAPQTGTKTGPGPGPPL